MKDQLPPPFLEMLRNFASADAVGQQEFRYNHISRAVERAIDILEDDALAEQHEATRNAVERCFVNLATELAIIFREGKDPFGALKPLYAMLNQFNEPILGIDKTFFKDEDVAEVYLQLRKQGSQFDQTTTLRLARMILEDREQSRKVRQALQDKIDKRKQ